MKTQGRNRCAPLVAALALLALGACGEKPQTIAAAQKKVDTPSWQGADNPFMASGWKPGDQVSWEEQIKKRAMGQNEYLRAN